MEGTKSKPTINVQHSPRESEVATTGGDTSASKQRSSAGLLPRNKRTDHLGIFRSASPVTTHSASSTNENSLFLALPAASKGRGRSLSAASLCNENGTSSFLSDEKLLIKSFEVLANAIGFKKSFSTSDILGIESSAQYSGNKPFFNLNRSHSEVQLSNYAPLFRLEASSRSLSTWVAVGDTSATTQLPSPQARVGSASPSFTPADLVRSVNKRIRQTYLKKRLLTTYKALERMSDMGFNLDKLKEVVSEGELAAHPDLVNLLSHHDKMNQNISSSSQKPMNKKTEAEVVKAASAVVAVAGATDTSQLGVTSMSGTTSNATGVGEATGSTSKTASKSKSSSKKEKSLSCKEVERDRGKPLSKFDRNVMIFDWLHGLDEVASIDLSAVPQS